MTPQPLITYKKGIDEKMPGADFMSYGISLYHDKKVEHENIILIHGDENLRNHILDLLWRNMPIPVAIQRLVEEVKVEKKRGKEPKYQGYNRTYHRHNR